MRGPAVTGLQFHPESVLTAHGGRLLSMAFGFASAVPTMTS